MLQLLSSRSVHNIAGLHKLSNRINNLLMRFQLNIIPRMFNPADLLGYWDTRFWGRDFNRIRPVTRYGSRRISDELSNYL